MQNRLRVARAEKKMTQFKLCLQTGINPSKLSLIENALIEPRSEEIRRIAKALNVSPSELFPEMK